MEGFLFYWIFWLGWIITTFFYRKDHPHRLLVSAWILGAIILSSVSFQFLGLEWSGTGLFIILTVYLYVAKLNTKKSLYFMLTSFILMLLTACFLLFELFDPVWILIKREWLIAFVIVYGSVLLHSDKILRLLSILLGMIQGEIFYAFIIKKFSFYYPIASPSFLDALSLTIVVILVWNSLELVAAFLNKHFHLVEKERQKIP